MSPYWWISPNLIGALWIMVTVSYALETIFWEESEVSEILSMLFVLTSGLWALSLLWSKLHAG